MTVLDGGDGSRRCGDLHDRLGGGGNGGPGGGRRQRRGAAVARAQGSRRRGHQRGAADLSLPGEAKVMDTVRLLAPDRLGLGGAQPAAAAARFVMPRRQSSGRRPGAPTIAAAQRKVRMEHVGVVADALGEAAVRRALAAQREGGERGGVAQRAAPAASAGGLGGGGAAARRPPPTPPPRRRPSPRRASVAPIQNEQHVSSSLFGRPWKPPTCRATHQSTRRRGRQPVERP